MTDNERKALLLKAKPILFNTDMVRAILDGRKTTTRRVVKPQPMSVITEKERRDRALSGADPYGFFVGTLDTELLKKAPYHSCDILYVRETWAELETVHGVPYWAYKADDQTLHHSSGENFERWHPSIYMPKEAARIFLRVTNVRVERLQDIITDGCLTPPNIHKEGVRKPCVLCIHPDFDCGDYIKNKVCDLITKYIELWNSTIKKSDLAKYGWDANPWVWVIEFERID